MSLPTDNKARKVINDAIKEMVDSKIRQDGEKELQAEIAEQISDKTEMSKAEFNKRAAIRYKEITNPQKFKEDIDWFDSVYDENEILKGGKDA